MMNFKQNEDAVSPVIGVILMVAITVILAAVIAAFVFGMSGNIQSTKNVAATATQQGTTIIVTYQGGADAQNVKHLMFSIKDDVKGYSSDAAGSIAASTGLASSKVNVGTSWKFPTEGTPNKDHVVVTAHFMDGSDQVILDTFV